MMQTSVVIIITILLKTFFSLSCFRCNLIFYNVVIAHTLKKTLIEAFFNVDKIKTGDKIMGKTGTKIEKKKHSLN